MVIPIEKYFLQIIKALIRTWEEPLNLKLNERVFTSRLIE